MPDAPVIANNTPLVALWVLGHLDLLQNLFGEILIPPAVHGEFLATETGNRQASLESAQWIHVMSLADPRRARVYVGLDQGESEVLALAEERQAGLVLIDERKGRRYAHRLGIPVTGTLGILLLAKEQNILPAIKPLIVQLQAAGLYLGSKLVDEALRLAQENDPSST